MTSAAADHRVGLEELVEESRERISRRLRGRDRATTLALAAGFLIVACSLATVGSVRTPSPGLVALLVLSYALASRVEFEIGAGSAAPTQLLLVPMLFILPAGIVPAAVAMGLVLGALPDVRDRRMHGERLMVQLVRAWHSVGPAGVMLAAGEPVATIDVWPVLAAALLAQFAFDFVSSGLRTRIAFGVSSREFLTVMGSVYAVDVVLAPIGFTIAIAAADAPSASLLGVPLIGLLASFAGERQRRIDHALELSHAYRGTAFLLGDVVAADDAYTGNHSRDVVQLSLAVADELGLSPRERRHVELTALLHDVGKIRIPNEIINKPGLLTCEERTLIETHTIEGERLLAKIGGLLGEVGQIVRSCHERWDGNGYPDGLAGREIPRVARVVTCCDAFNAMTTDRSYRRALPVDDAIAELRRNAGSQFDPAVVEALVRCVPSLL